MSRFLIVIFLFLIVITSRAQAADRDQIRGQRCLSTVNALTLSGSSDTAELEKNIRCVRRLLSAESSTEVRKSKNKKKKKKDKKGKKKKDKKNKKR